MEENNRLESVTTDVMVIGSGIGGMEAMRKALIAKGIKLMSRVCITELIVENGQVKGAVGFDTEKGDFLAFRAKAIVLVSGGYRYKCLAPGNRNCTGDGAAMAYDAGAIMGCDEVSLQGPPTGPC